MICAKFGSSIWKKHWRIFIWINLNPFYPMILRHAKFGWNRPGSGEEDKNLNTNRWWTMNIRPSEKFSSVKNSKKDVDMVPNLWILKTFQSTLNISIYDNIYSPRQAYPAAEDARPAAVGKLFSEQMCSFHWSLSFTWSLSDFLFLQSLLTRWNTYKTCMFVYSVWTFF